MSLESVYSGWKKLGANFNVGPAPITPDLERLLIETAGVIPENSRLYVVVLSWLAANYRLVCRHRLAGLAAGISDPVSSAVLGFMLEEAKTILSTDHFNIAIKQCESLTEPRPLFLVDCISDSFKNTAEAKSGDISRKWGLWCEDISLKPESVRPVSWIINNNPALIHRAIFNGNLRASIIETLKHDSDSGQSESLLARCCNVTRKALRDALDHLEYCQAVHRVNTGSKVRIILL